VKVRRVEPGDSNYPAIRVGRLPIAASPAFYAMGDLSILHHPLLGLICSIQCPGSIIIKTFDFIRKLRDEKVVVIGGFHSPTERECLDLLLRGPQPVILCPARGVCNLRMGKEARKAVAEGRLLVLSLFGDDVRRTTASQSILRNDMVAALAAAILVPYATQNGKTWTTVRRALGYGQKIVTFEDDANTDLITSGAMVCKVDHLQNFFNEAKGSSDVFQWLFT
jgi:predicted Rossmann fold nucleotide-binding protein DprA/Smf involved in DNA uptake